MQLHEDVVCRWSAFVDVFCADILAKPPGASQDT